jgi:hypothetical protein
MGKYFDLSMFEDYDLGFEDLDKCRLECVCKEKGGK